MQNEVRANALSDIAAERRRQIEVEGWTPEHDDEHGAGEMARAAACYALGEEAELYREFNGSPISENVWPWDGAWWKPKSRREDLIRAAALIMAEIERLDRAALASKGKADGR